MSIFAKDLDLFSKEDLELFVTSAKREGVSLEYKREINGSDKGKHDLIRHVVGMANAEGGFIVFGIEEDNKAGTPVSLSGMAESVGGQKADEWIENVVNQNTSPRVTIRVKAISTSPAKIAIVLRVPPSGRGPHMSTYDNAFYLRYNTQTRPASALEVREMHQRSGKVEGERKGFLERRNLSDRTSDSFCHSENYLKLSTQTGKPPADSPAVVLSSCPRLLEERVDIGADSIRDWLKDNPTVKVEGRTVGVFKTHDFQTGSDSVTCSYTRPAGGARREVLEYVEIQRNGFVEQGLCRRLIRPRNGSQLFLDLGGTAVALWAFLKFLRSFYQKIGYLGEFSAYLSVRNADQLDLHGFMGEDKHGVPWAAPGEDEFYTGMPEIPLLNPVHPEKPSDRNLQHQRDLAVGELDDQKISETVRKFSTRISNSFGLQKAYCYNADGSLATVHLDHPMRNFW